MKTRLSAKLAIHDTNQPGFVNDGSYYDPRKPRKAFVQLPCVYLEKPADDLFRRDEQFRAEVESEARQAMAYYNLTSIHVYDRDGELILTYNTEPIDPLVMANALTNLGV